MPEDLYTQILKRLDFHSERLNKHGESIEDLTRIARRVEDLARVATKNQHYLFGNGEAGLDERVRGVEKSIDMLEKKFDAWTNVGKWFSGVVGAYVLLEVVKFILAGI